MKKLITIMSVILTLTMFLSACNQTSTGQKGIENLPLSLYDISAFESSQMIAEKYKIDAPKEKVLEYAYTTYVPMPEYQNALEMIQDLDTLKEAYGEDYVYYRYYPDFIITEVQKNLEAEVVISEEQIKAEMESGIKEQLLSSGTPESEIKEYVRKMLINEEINNKLSTELEEYMNKALIARFEKSAPNAVAKIVTVEKSEEDMTNETSNQNVEQQSQEQKSESEESTQEVGESSETQEGEMDSDGSEEGKK